MLRCTRPAGRLVHARCLRQTRSLNFLNRSLPQLVSCSVSFGSGKVELTSLEEGSLCAFQVPGPKSVASSKRLGLYAIASHGDMCVYLCAYADLILQRTVKHKHGVYAVAFAHTMPLVISGDGNGIIKITDCTTGELVNEINLHRSFVNALEVSRDDEVLLVSSADCTASVLHMRNPSLRTILTGHTASVNASILIQSGLTVVTASSGARPQS
jgi:WD40 repeat protein